jgi:hypothetical protein
VLGIMLAVAGIPGAALLTAAASFVGLFPPMLLSMVEAKSALAPVNNEVWVSIRERPDPWKLNYLIIGVFTIGGLMGFYASFFGSFLVALAGATAMVACAMICFRTVGRLICFLAGRDEKPAATP